MNDDNYEISELMKKCRRGEVPILVQIAEGKGRKCGVKIVYSLQK